MWLEGNSSGLLKLRSPHKNHFLDLLLGIALYLRDVYYISLQTIKTVLFLNIWKAALWRQRILGDL